jgi:hypothetical protein
MSELIEQLEGRTLMSASPMQLLGDEGAAGGAAHQIQAALNAYQRGYHNDLKIITADIKAIGASARASTRNLGKKLQTDEDKAIAHFLADYGKLTKLETISLTQLNGDAFKAHPTAADLAAKAKHLAAFESQGQTGTTKFLTDVGAAVTILTTDATALGAANPSATKLNADLQTMITHAGANATAIQTAIAAGGTASATIIADLT